MGASKRGDIKELVEIAHPNVGVITNVGRAHLEGFGSQQGILETKSELFDYLQAHQGKILLNIDDPLLWERWHGSESIGFGLTTHTSIQGAEVVCDPYLKMKLLINGISQPVTSQLVGKYNAYNVLAATALATTCDISPKQVAEAIATYHPSNHRSQLIVGTKGRQMIADAYNANPSSMMEALENISAQHATHKLVLLGDMRELGHESLQEHQRIIDWLTRHPEITPLLCGEEFGKVAQERMKQFPTNRELESYLQENQELPADLVVLVKGSHGIGLEQLLPRLETMINS
ncbi:putative UDP-N-acetylmuramoyl-tripeptide--D-alanyl-D-alanine ligase [Chlamydia trachomatis]|nr:putative UDP-N-acetylmuramoyl-tripeptide--D-alanyl-D-alanine ligase [Chlamydia trachomatis]